MRKQHLRHQQGPEGVIDVAHQSDRLFIGLCSASIYWRRSVGGLEHVTRATESTGYPPCGDAEGPPNETRHSDHRQHGLYYMCSRPRAARHPLLNLAQRLLSLGRVR